VGVDKRRSDVVLTVASILERISDFDIFKYYCTPFRVPGNKFSSELREDPIPSAIISLINRRLRYKDFGYPEHAFDSFGYVQAKYDLTFVETLHMINNDFRLGLSSKKPGEFTNKYRGLSRGKVKFKQIKSVIRYRSRLPNWTDELYWEEFLIQKTTRRTFFVKPIDYYWINDNRFKAPKVCYVYYEHSPRFKVYSPLVAEGKWYGNVRAKDIQGWADLPPFGDRIYITSSLKDAMVLFEVKESAIALQSESGMMPKNLMDHLKHRFKEVIILYDNDFDKDENPGQRMAKKICEEHGVRNICIPTELECKDPALVMAAHGPITLKRIVRS